MLDSSYLNQKRKQKIAVIGGGISGLSFTFFLEQEAQKQGIDLEILLVEKDSRPGGKIHTTSRDKCILEQGPDTIHATSPEILDLINELGLESEIVFPLKSSFGIVRSNRIHKIPSALLRGGFQSFKALMKLTVVSFRAKMECIIRNVFFKAPNLECTIAEFGRQKFGVEFSSIIFESLLAGVHSGDAKELSMQALYPFLVSSKKKKPKNKKSMFALKGGLGMLPSKIKSSLNFTHPIFEQEVLEIKESKNRFEVVLSNETLHVDKVIIAASAYQAAELMKNSFPKVSEKLSEINYASTAVANLGFSAKDIENWPQGTGFIIPQDEQKTISACTWSSCKWPKRSPEDIFLVRAFLSKKSVEELLASNDENLVLSSVSKEVASYLNLKQSPSWAEVKQWPLAMPQYKIGHSTLVKEIEELTAQANGLYLLGAAYKGSGIPSCVRQAKILSAHIMQELISAKSLSVELTIEESRI